VIKTARGAPVTVGFVSDDSAEVEAATAAVDYANTYLLGLGGRPIRLQVCATDRTAGGAVDCADRMIAAKVPIVLAGGSVQAGAISKRLDEAKVPQLWYAAVDRVTLLAADSFVMTNGVATTFGVPAAYGQGKGYKSALEIVTDVPPTIGPTKDLAVPIYRNAGIALEVVGIAQDAGDVASLLHDALAAHPDFIHVTGNDLFCLGVFEALRASRYAGEIVTIPACISAATVGTVSGGLRHVSVVVAASDDPDDVEAARYRAVMKRYAPGADPSAPAMAAAYAVVLGLVRATAAGLPDDITSAAIVTAMRTMPDATLPLAAALTFRCDGTALSLARSICSRAALVAQLDADGQPTSYARVDPSRLMTFEAGQP
jgi:branched-chain amino acid transport system substrate-binding protein